jgi:hypothetical protein
MAADRQVNPVTSTDCSKVFDTELEERGPLFSHILDLRSRGRF